MARKKKTPNPNVELKLKTTAPPVKPSAQSPVAAVSIPSTGDARRDALLAQQRSAQQALDRESASGFGDRSERAAKNLERANKELADYDSSQNYGERAYTITVNVGAPIVGMVAGHKLAANLNAKHTAAVQARNKELVKLQGKADRILAKPRITPAQRGRLKAIVQSAEHLGLGRIKGPLGVVTGGLLVTEGLMSRSILAPQVDNEYAKELLRSVGTASVFAATSLIGERMIQNATQKTLPSATALASVNEARIASDKTPRAGSKAHKAFVRASKGSMGSKALRVLGGGFLRVATPVAVGVAVAAAWNSSAKAGESGSTQATKAAAAGLDAIAFGVPTMANDALKQSGHGSVPEFISSTVMGAFGFGKKTPKQKQAILTPPIQAASRHSRGPLTRVASAGRARTKSPVTTTNVKAHFKHADGKGIFTRGHVRIVKPSR